MNLFSIAEDFTGRGHIVFASDATHWRYHVQLVKGLFEESESGEYYRKFAYIM